MMAQQLDRPLDWRKAGAARGLRIEDLAQHELAVLHRVAMPGDEAVVHDDTIPGQRERFRRVAADIAGAAGDQHRPRFTGQWKYR